MTLSEGVQYVAGGLDEFDWRLSTAFILHIVFWCLFFHIRLWGGSLPAPGAEQGVLWNGDWADQDQMPGHLHPIYPGLRRWMSAPHWICELGIPTANPPHWFATPSGWSTQWFPVGCPLYIGKAGACASDACDAGSMFEVQAICSGSLFAGLGLIANAHVLWCPLIPMPPENGPVQRHLGVAIWNRRRGELLRSRPAISSPTHARCQHNRREFGVDGDWWSDWSFTTRWNLKMTTGAAATWLQFIL